MVDSLLLVGRRCLSVFTLADDDSLVGLYGELSCATCRPAGATCESSSKCP